MSNIQIGIDLGTTNSEIAILNNGNVEIVKNHLGDEYTPSVFGINKAKNETVGKKPYENLYKFATAQEIENNKAEVKRLMGTSDKVYFSRVEQSYSAEEISAKILLALKQDAIAKKSDINTTGVVITIPAHFSTIQAEATKRAGELAGFGYVLLLQEPIAAAISYGFGNNENGNWLVYDLGGGTFDSAIISLKDNNLSILSHNGDNYLGGKDVDWLIVENVIIPFLNEKYNPENLDRSNKDLNTVFSKLKYAAENAKIQLSRAVEVNIEIDLTINDREIYENILMTCSDLEKLMADAINKTIELCKKTISEACIKSESINKIILVGGPTQLPFIKERLKKELNIPVDTSGDPLTAVARGACIYANSQIVPQKYFQKVEFDENTYEVNLNYDSLTSEEEQLVTGVLPALKENGNEYFVQIQSQNNIYNSGKVKLNKGKFIINIALESNKTNDFWIYLFDKDGNSLNLIPDSFSITHGLSVSGVPIPHSIGVGVTNKDKALGIINQEFDIFFEKNSILPLEKTKIYKTVKELKKGDIANCLPITIYEGEYKIPDRNYRICEIALTGEELPYDLPAGSDVEVKIKVNESREVSVEAYLPIIDLAFDARATIYDEDLDVEQMDEDLDKETERLKEFDHLCESEERQKLYSSIQDIKHSIKKSENDEDEKRKTNIKIKSLKSSIDNLEKDKNTEVLKEKFYELVKNIEEGINSVKEEDKKQEFLKRFDSLKTDGNKAVKTNNEILLNRINSQLEELNGAIIMSNDFIWLMWLRDLAENHTFTNEKQAEYYINKGIEAYKEGDMHEVKNCVHQLHLLLPEQEKINMDKKLAGITY